MRATDQEMREMGVLGLLIYCAGYRCSHSIAISGDAWPDDARLSDIEDRFVCRACGKRGADLRPDFNRVAPSRDGLSIGLISGPVAGRDFGMPFLASSLDELIRSGPSSG
jgi:hypothetical protein